MSAGTPTATRADAWASWYASRLLRFLPQTSVLEYTGGGPTLAPYVERHIRRFVSVSAPFQPFGTEPAARFDAAYVVPVLSTLQRAELVALLEFLADVVTPGGIVLVDVKLAPPRAGRHQHDDATITAEELAALTDPSFTAVRIPLLNHGMMLVGTPPTAEGPTRHWANHDDVEAPAPDRLVNVRTGTYYSLNENGATIWQLLATGYSADEIASEAPVDASFGSQDVQGFASQLVEEGLLVPAALISAPLDRSRLGAEVDGTYPALVRVPRLQRRAPAAPNRAASPWAPAMRAAVMFERFAVRVGLALGAIGAALALVRLLRRTLTPLVALGGITGALAAAPSVPVLRHRWRKPRTTMMTREVYRRLGRSPATPLVGWRPLEQMSPELGLAVIAAEDGYFRHHGGFDVFSIRDALANNRAGRPRLGASTITQQVAKNLYLWSGRSYLRKALETYLTLLLEALWPKRRLLEVYLNIAQFGKDVFGVEAAAQRFFHKPAETIDRVEAAALAVVLPNPAKLSVEQPDRAQQFRQAGIQRSMAAHGATYLEHLGWFRPPLVSRRTALTMAAAATLTGLRGTRPAP